MHDHFRKLICDNPADIGPRLVYADWLEEQGDPRGEFIRVQCALSGMTDDDQQRATLKQLERELLGKHEREWLRPLEQLLGPNEPRQPVAAVTGWLASLLPREIARVVRGVATSTLPAWNAKFKRGFIERLEIDNDRLLSAPNIPRHFPLRKLSVYSGMTTPRNPMAWMTNDLMKHICELQIRVHPIDESLWRETWNNVHCPTLDAIMFTGLRFHGTALIADTTVASQLKSVSVVGSPLNSSDIAAISRFERLTVLTLYGIPIDANAIAELSQQPICRQIEALNVSECGIGNPAVLHLDTSRFPSLKQLILDACEMGDSAGEHLATNPLLQQLSLLSLGENQITERGAMALADSPNWRGPTKLDLRGNPISPDVCRALKIRFGERILVDGP